MDHLIKGKTSKGKFYVRPVNWAGGWDKDLNLVGGNTLFESDKEEEIDIYMEEYSDDKNTSDFNGIKECITNSDELKKLIAENPDLPIMFMCGEECYCDDFGYTINTGRFNIEEVTSVDDMVCDDKADLEDKIYCKLDRKYPNASEELLNKLTDEKLEKYIWKKVITIRLG